MGLDFLGCLFYSGMTGFVNSLLKYGLSPQALGLLFFLLLPPVGLLIEYALTFAIFKSESEKSKAYLAELLAGQQVTELELGQSAI